MFVATATVEPKFLTINEAAARYRCSRAHLYSLKDRGLITIKKLGNKSLIDVAQVDAVIAASVAAE